MALSSTLTTGLSGLIVNQTQLNVVGNNIANANTTAFKSSSVLFSPQFYETQSTGSPSTSTSGGSNPSQVGLGAQVSDIEVNFAQGSLQSTGVASDLAINGNGFFVVQNPSNAQYYTRDGAFTVNSSNQLVDSSGNNVMGYGVNSEFQLSTNSLQKITLPPPGLATVAKATTTATLSGNLDAASPVASSGTVFTSQPLQDSTGAAVTSASLLTNLQDFGATGTTGLYNVGDVITLSPQQDGRNLPSQSYTVTATSSVQDLQTFFQNTMGIDSAATAGTPGSSIAAATGGGQQLVTTGNVGVENSLSISNNTGLLVNGSSASPIALTTTPSTDTDLGSHTPITAYDSLGDPIQLNVNTVLTSEGTTGSTWQFTVTSPGNQAAGPDGQNPVLGTGTLQFNTSGQFVSATPSTFTINRSTAGAVASQPITLDFSKVQALAGAKSSIVNSAQDGFPFGSFSSYSVGADGTITGTYSNGQTETVGQVVLATFQNPTGLVNQGSNNYTAGAASGTAVITTPNGTGTGSIESATLEQSNVDLSQEFINLIIASTGYSASSKVISTSNQLLTELLNTVQG